MTKAEEAAIKAYPVYGKWIGNQYGYWDNDINSTLRKAYLQGYEQAKKDTNPQEQPEVFDTIAFQKGVREGKRLAVETIQSRIDEILGDAQPAPILRMELQELIKKINQ